MQVLSRTPSGAPALVLNANFRPLSYYPLSLWSWQETIKAVFSRKGGRRLDLRPLDPFTEFRDAPSECRLAQEFTSRRIGRRPLPASTFFYATDSLASIAVDQKT